MKSAGIYRCCYSLVLLLSTCLITNTHANVICANKLHPFSFTFGIGCGTKSGDESSIKYTINCEVINVSKGSDNGRAGTDCAKTLTCQGALQEDAKNNFGLGECQMHKILNGS